MLFGSWAVHSASFLAVRRLYNFQAVWPAFNPFSLFFKWIALLCISESGPGNQFKNWISSFVPKYQQQHINNNTSTTTKTFTFLKEVYIYMYHIVPGLCPWALAAQTSKIEGRRLHGGGASMVQLSQWKRPPKIQNTCTLELNRPSSLLCLCFVEASSMVVALLC